VLVAQPLQRGGLAGVSYPMADADSGVWPVINSSP
jgi:hypothetical protein